MADEETMNPAAIESPAAEASEASGAGPALETLQRERDDYYDRLLRKTAEFDNYRRRVERERREQADQAVVDLLQDVLLIVDDFERALTVAAGEDASAYRKGVELIHSKLQDLLRKRGVKPIEAIGRDFDPNVHQAVSHESSPNHREGEVIGEMRRGYTMGDRLLRPAMVKVAKA
jgi:molecular chaperone GrpE